jgi:hypothetical protein
MNRHDAVGSGTPRPSRDIRRVEAQRRRRLVGQGAFVLVLGAAFGFKVGPLYAAVTILVLFGIIYGAIYSVLGMIAHKEKVRRRRGEAPSWATVVPRSMVESVSGAANHSAPDSSSVVAGRLTLAAAGLSWEPISRSGGDHLAVQPIMWDHTWVVCVRPLWGTGRQGRLTLVHPDHGPFEMWVRFPRDVQWALDDSHLHWRKG